MEGGAIFGPIVPIGKLRLSRVKLTAGKCQNWDLNLGSLAPVDTFFLN